MTSLNTSSARARRVDNSAFGLLFALAIAGGLTIAGIPAFREYTLSTHRRLAADLLDDAFGQWQAHVRSDPRSRLLSLESLGFPGPVAYLSADGTVHDAANGSSIYRVGLSLPDTAYAERCGLASNIPGSDFVLVAQPVNAQAADSRCASFCLSSSGERRTTGPAGATECWHGEPG
jgi:Tfp pilus assembly protein PilE